MPNKSKVKELAARENKTVREILIGLYEAYGQQTLVAESIGVDQSTISLWVAREGLQEKTILVPRNQVSTTK
jgi:hypothetical protein